ncbi:hypothetical protein ACGFZP_05045 [Kitasatospora sp. NPDC048239]|uniref:hypothetical protein n=1 Tax=Kitasatospora sp. NPDC048239 TaxID=3364046 RepID=UPI003724B33D
MALELAELRRSVDVGNAKTQGQLQLLVQRGDQTDRKVDSHETRLDQLERKVYIAIGAGSLLGTLGGYLVPLVSR